MLIDELDLGWLLFLFVKLIFIPDLRPPVETKSEEMVLLLLFSWPNTLSDWVTTVSTKFEVVNLLEPGVDDDVVSFGILRSLAFFSSITPSTSKLGLVFNLFFKFNVVDDLRLELLRFTVVEVFEGKSISFSGDESEDPLSAGIGL